MKDKIKEEEEYKNYPEIFNDNNINNFTINDIFSILDNNLKSEGISYSIAKNDITNYNLFIEVITEFLELKDVIYNKNLDVKI